MRSVLLTNKSSRHKKAGTISYDPKVFRGFFVTAELCVIFPNLKGNIFE